MSQYPNLTVNSKGHLKFGGCDLIALAGKFGTPLYVMNEDIIRSNAIRYAASLTKKECYSMLSQAASFTLPYAPVSLQAK